MSNILYETPEEVDRAIADARARGVREGLEMALKECDALGVSQWATDAAERITALIAALPKEGS